MFNRRGITIDALGQTWHFTAAAIRSLGLTENEAFALLKMVVIEHGTAQGYTEGVFDVETGGFVLRFTVSANEITVDQPAGRVDSR